jgi:hypothetical protein
VIIVIVVLVFTSVLLQHGYNLHTALLGAGGAGVFAGEVARRVVSPPQRRLRRWTFNAPASSSCTAVQPSRDRRATGGVADRGERFVWSLIQMESYQEEVAA